MNKLEELITDIDAMFEKLESLELTTYEEKYSVLEDEVIQLKLKLLLLKIESNKSTE